MRLPAVIAPLAVVAAVLGVTTYAVQPPPTKRPSPTATPEEFSSTVASLNAALTADWTARGLAPAGRPMT